MDVYRHAKDRLDRSQLQIGQIRNPQIRLLGVSTLTEITARLLGVSTLTPMTFSAIVFYRSTPKTETELADGQESPLHKRSQLEMEIRVLH